MVGAQKTAFSAWGLRSPHCTIFADKREAKTEPFRPLSRACPRTKEVFSDIHTIGIGAAKVAATFLCAGLAVLAANPLQSKCLPDGGKHYQANTDRSRYG